MECMRWMILAAAAACAACAVNPATQASTVHTSAAHEAVDGLLAADRSFSQAAEGKSLVDAITSMLADDATMPVPRKGFADGRDAIVTELRSNPANANATASWAPVRAGVSADGTHGFTYGFMTISEAGEQDQRAKYLAYWIKRADGWRVVGYKRAPSPKGEVDLALRPPSLPSAFGQVAPTRATIEAHRASLAAAEKAFSDRAQLVGLGPAFAEFGSPDAMNLGRGADFTYGNQAIAADMPADGGKSPLYWSGDHRVLVAPSGDLGVTFGTIRTHEPPAAGQPGEFPFFTVWRRAAPDQPWRYVAE